MASLSCSLLAPVRVGRWLLPVPRVGQQYAMIENTAVVSSFMAFFTDQDWDCTYTTYCDWSFSTCSVMSSTVPASNKAPIAEHSLLHHLFTKKPKVQMGRNSKEKKRNRISLQSPTMKESPEPEPVNESEALCSRRPWCYTSVRVSGQEMKSSV